MQNITETLFAIVQTGLAVAAAVFLAALLVSAGPIGWIAGGIILYKQLQKRR